MTFPRYSYGAIALHWTIAVLLISQIAVGLWMTKLPKEAAALKLQVFQLHKSVGITILLLTLIRILWRLTHRPPALPDAMAGWEKVIARATHFLFYALLITIPMLGWAIVSSSTRHVPTVLYWEIPWPNLPLPSSRELSHNFGEAHEYAAFAAIALIVLHVGAALKHYLVNRDGVLSRMAPFIQPRS
ncbi:MAG TPA: cytochrome b [Parvularculaceae bacterium]|nr:cytochrome b [Parvularculaceae bacterium]